MFSMGKKAPLSQEIPTGAVFCRGYNFAYLGSVPTWYENAKHRKYIAKRNRFLLKDFEDTGKEQCPDHQKVS